MAKGRTVGKLDFFGRDRVQTVNTEDSQTVQSDAHLADLNQIMASYGAQGLGLLDEAALNFADVSSFTDLADALNQAKEAEVEFMKLPSKVREVFEHDVAVWLDTAHDEEKRDALVALGFLKEKIADGGGVPVVPVVPVVPPAADPPAVVEEPPAGA